MTGRWRRREHAADQTPAPAASPRPVPGTPPVPGRAFPRPDATPPASSPGTGPPPRDSIYGRCVMTACFYDTGITVTYDHTRRRRIIDIPPADQWDGWAKEMTE